MSRPLRALVVVRLFYGFQFFFSLLLWHPIFYEYQKRFGLTDPEIFGIQSLYYLAFCLCEFPTGFLADRWSQRKCMGLGAVLLVGCNLLPILAPTYQGFLWHWLLLALSRSLISGASSAYMYNYLQQHGEPEGYKQVEGRARAYSLMGKVVGWAGIGYLMELHVTLPYWLTAFSAALSVLFAWKLPEVFADAPQAARREISTRAALLLLTSSPRMMLVMLQGIGIFVLTRIIQVNLFQPILKEKGFGVAALGLIMALNTLFEALGAAYPNLLRRWFSDLNAVFLLTFAMAVCMLGTARGGPWATLTWLNLFALAAGLSYPIQRQVLNDAIPDSRYRASMLSAESLLDRAVCAWVAAQLGGYVGQGLLDHFLDLGAGITSVAILFLIPAFYLTAAQAARRSSGVAPERSPE